MKKVRVTDDVKVVGVKNFAGRDKLVDYYVIIPGQRKIYAFSKIYTDRSYDMCKSGIRMNDLVGVRSRDTGVMRLVDYIKLMLPYLAEEYGIPVAA